MSAHFMMLYVLGQRLCNVEHWFGTPHHCLFLLLHCNHERTIITLNTATVHAVQYSSSQ